MAYNRCIGTRYCANNCPYKVRRFNFLDWNKEFREARNEGPPPAVQPGRHRAHARRDGEVHVLRAADPEREDQGEGRDPQRPARRRGQRRRCRTATIVTACQMACPTEAIVFGDLADPDSRVVARCTSDRRAATRSCPRCTRKPRTRYLARVRNPNPDARRALASRKRRLSDEHAKPQRWTRITRRPARLASTFRKVTRDVAWVAEAPKPHKLWLVALGDRGHACSAIGIYSHLRASS